MAKIYSDTLDSKPANAMVEYSYTPTAQVDVTTFKDASGNTIQTIDHDYTKREWLDTISAGAFWADLNYDFVGNVDMLNQKIDSDLDGSINDESEYGYDFGYDESYRLLSAMTTGTPAVSVGYKYDKNGNILGLNRGSAGVPATTYFYYANNNRLEYVTSLGQSAGNYTYDTNGNLLRDIKKGISTDVLYDFRNQPYSITLPAITLKFGYDGGGNRIVKEFFGN